MNNLFVLVFQRKKFLIFFPLHVIFFQALCFSLLCQENNFVPFTNSKISYEGRIGRDGSSAILYWPGTQIEINFKGKELKALFYDNTGKNYYNIIIDEDSVLLFKPDSEKKVYTLITGLSDEIHNLKIYKRTEWNRGITYFYGFVLDGSTKLLDPPQKKARRMEFYGNSVTAGFGIEDFSGLDRSDSIYTNNYLTYAALTARHFNARAHYIVRSGIGVMVSWFPLIMPEMYDRINPNDSIQKWNFGNYQPDVVVINLFQNDAYLLKMPKSKEFLYRFEKKPFPDENEIIKSYCIFVRKLREKYPNAYIICMLGNLSITKKDSPWPGYVEKAVKIMNDNRISCLFIPYKNTEGHPKVAEQRKMADELIRFIEKNIKW